MIRPSTVLRFLPLTFVMLLAASDAVGAPSDAAAGIPLTADEIMERVAANQDRTEAARVRYIYRQHIRVVSRKPGGKVMCEEVTDSRISPNAKQSHQQLMTLDGREWNKGTYFHYSSFEEHVPAATSGKDNEPGREEYDDGMDRDLVENLRKNLTGDGSDDTREHGHIQVNADEKSENPSKDGLAKGLFPLTTQQQSKYLFKLEGRQTMNGRDVYHISFRPKDKNDFNWKGEAYIDAKEFEPVVVYTVMSRKIPLAVRTLLGTNLPGLGFSVTYDRQPDGVWFPVSFGTEFRMRVLFFIARDISMSMANTHFEKTHADMRILDGVKLADSTSEPASAH